MEAIKNQETTDQNQKNSKVPPQKQPSEDILVVKVNQPDYIQGAMWELIVELADKMAKPGMSAHSLMTFFLYGAMKGLIELWGAVEQGTNKCMGFIVFQVLEAPYYSTGLCNFVFISKSKYKKKIDKMFAEEFIKFLKRYRLKYFIFNTRHKRLADKWAKDLAPALNIKREEYIFTGSRKLGG